MLRGKFRFTDDPHQYFVCGKHYRYVVPGTTDILAAAGYYPGRRFMTRAGRARGSVIHELTAALDLGLVNLAQLERMTISGYLRAYVMFLEERQPRFDPEHTEGAAINRRLGFATHVDRAGVLRGPMVLNIKTGARSSADPVQAALEVLALDGRWSTRHRYTLYLRKSSSYKLVEHINDGDEGRALEGLSRWRHNEHNEKTHGKLRLLDPLPSF